MKKAVLYARVSSLLQKKEGTVESQITALKEQIMSDGNVLVKEYVDNGHSGARLDRPALDELREDIKTDKFDTIYFWNTDRIARDVAYQTIIIAEILKYQKQIIINGKDYVHNPENKFSLTVLGAVSELERAKIMERIMRGKKHKLRSGVALNNGMNMFGYNYIRKTSERDGYFEINEREAETVRYIFDSYETGASWSQIVRGLTNNKMVTKSGSLYWRTENVRQLLQRHTYTGIKYYNTRYHSKKHSDPLKKLKYGKKIYRDKSEWIAVPFPQIILKKQFDEVQAKLEASSKKYRKPKETQLLSGLVVCGNCGRSWIAYQRYTRAYYKYKGAYKRSGNTYHRVAYRCALKYRNRVHGENAELPQCNTPEVSAKRLEPLVWDLVHEYLTSPKKLKAHLQYSSADIVAERKRITTALKQIEGEITKYKKQKKDCLNQYTEGKIDRIAYGNLCSKADILVLDAEDNKENLIKDLPAEIREEMIDVSLSMYCEAIKARLKHCVDFDSKRSFLLETITDVTYMDEKVTLKGCILVGSDKQEFQITQHLA